MGACCRGCAAQGHASIASHRTRSRRSSSVRLRSCEQRQLGRVAAGAAADRSRVIQAVQRSRSECTGALQSAWRPMLSGLRPCRPVQAPSAQQTFHRHSTRTWRCCCRPRCARRRPSARPRPAGGAVPHQLPSSPACGGSSSGGAWWRGKRSTAETRRHAAPAAAARQCSRRRGSSRGGPTATSIRHHRRQLQHRRRGYHRRVAAAAGGRTAVGRAGCPT